MKRTLCFLLALILLLSGCSLSNGNVKDPVEFYYLRTCGRPEENKVYFSEGPIASEIREASGRRDDLYYLLSMYMRGPLDPDLQSPFPAGSTVVKIWQEDQALHVVLNAIAANLEDLDLSLAVACLAQTCIALTDIEIVHIECRGIDNIVLFSTMVTDSSFLLEDTVSAFTTPAETTQ